MPSPPSPSHSSGPLPPVAACRPVVQSYHGVEVRDDYQWLEARTDPEVLAWTAGQTSYAASRLSALAGVAALRERVVAFKTAQSADYYRLAWRGPFLFALELDPAQGQQARLVRMDLSADPSTARVVVDPNALDAGGSISIDFYVPSPDGSLVAVSLSRGGTESGTLHVFDVATGHETGDVLPRVNGGTAGGSAAWNELGDGLFYTRYPSSGERPAADLGFYQQVYFHRLGDDVAHDVYVVGRDYPRIAEIHLFRREDGRYLLIQVANGDGGEVAFWLRDGRGELRQISKFEDEIAAAGFGSDDGVYLLSRKDAPLGRILRVPAGQPDLALAREVVGQGDCSIREFVVTATRIYVVRVAGGPSHITVHDLGGHHLADVPVAPVASVNQIVASGTDDALFYRSQTFISPPSWYLYRDGKVEQTPLRVTSPVAFDDAEVLREMCVSKDGTQVPVNIVCKRGAVMDGSMPGLLTAYGGYGVNLSPRFQADARLWLDKGGFVAIANLRGGAEFGEAWHKAGYLEHKQNVFDDMAACARHLIARGYTSARRLAIVGGSNGGLLMGAMATQHPELFRAVVSYVGIYDMLRVELTPNGSYNVTEYGSVKDPRQFRALYAYSPYHRVTDGAPCPSMLLVTGENDPRVDAWHSKKMAARLQRACPSSTVLLVTRPDSGHGIGRSLQEDIDDTVREASFLFHELGVEP